MKQLKFKSNLIPLILSGEKTVTWRIFDDKNLNIEDELEFINKDNGKVFGRAQIISIKEKAIKEITNIDFSEGHEKYENKLAMVNKYQEYYGDQVDDNTKIKMIKFDFKIIHH